MLKPKNEGPWIGDKFKNSEVGMRPPAHRGHGAYAPEGSRKKAKPMEPGNKLPKKLVI